MPAVPPIETRFKPGQSGNPNGRPKGSLNLTNMLRDKLNEVAIGEDKKTYADLLIQQTLEKAIKDGDVSMIKYCYDRLDGTPIDSVKVSGDPENPIRIVEVKMLVKDQSTLPEAQIIDIDRLNVKEYVGDQNGD